MQHINDTNFEGKKTEKKEENNRFILFIIFSYKINNSPLVIDKANKSDSIFLCHCPSVCV